jgi:hypothetical protein
MLHSDGKIELFYKSVVIVLALTLELFASTGGIYAGSPHPASGQEVPSAK